jgi:hypothetical protein
MVAGFKRRMGKMRSLRLVSFLLMVTMTSAGLLAQDEGKGDLEDFADDYGEEESGSNDSDGAGEFFMAFLIDNAVDILRLWGGTPGTEFGPYPSHPYTHGAGFLTTAEDYRSFFFNTEINYHYLNDHLRSYIVKWETQFNHAHKLSFDLALYGEDRVAAQGIRYQDRLSFYGFRYGYAIARAPGFIMNLEGGLRGFYRNATHNGPEVAFDLQVFPGKPLILETELAAALLSDGWLYTFESSAGILLGRVEVLAGMRILKNQSTDLLDGLRFGLRIWY